MKLSLVKPGIEYNAPVSPIALLKDSIAIGVLELNEHARNGHKMSFLRTREVINKKVDEYIKLRTLTLV